MEIAPGIRRLGTGRVNVYLIEEPGGITIVDAGLPGYWGDLQAELAAMGRSLEDVRAVLLTHAHDDHIGFAERIRSERGTPIHLHEADAALARGEAKQKNEGGGPVKPIPLLVVPALRPAQGRPADQADRRGLDVRRRRDARRARARRG